MTLQFPVDRLDRRRPLQHIRNLCDYDKHREPTAHEVGELLAELDTIAEPAITFCGCAQLRCEAVAARAWPGSRAAYIVASGTASRRLQFATRCSQLLGGNRGSIELWTKSKKMTKWSKEAGVNWMS